MKALEPVDQHRTIRFIEHVPTNLDDAVRPNPDQISIERRVVEAAKRDSVRYRRLTKGICIRQDVCGLEQFLAFEATDGAVVLVGAYDSLAERSLM